MKIFSIFLLVVWGLLAFVQPALAVNSRFSVFSYGPAHDSRFFTMASTQTLGPRHFSLKFSNHFSWHPLNGLNNAGVGVGSVVDYYTAHVFEGKYGMGKWGEVGLFFPVFGATRFDEPELFPVTGFENHYALPGDVRLSLKTDLSKISPLNLGKKWSLGVESFLTIPTLQANDFFLGEGKPTGGFAALIDYQPVQSFLLSLNIGPEFRERATINNINFQYRVFASFGGSLKFQKRWRTSVELKTKTPMENLFDDKDTTPTEVNGGVRWQIPKTDLSLEMGGGTCLVCGTGSGKINSFLNLSFQSE